MGTIPLDILLYIIDLLAVGDDEDVKSLQMLSQACKSMVPLCRKHLFSSIRLISESKSERFSDLLSKNPDIARYVRNLYYSFFHIPQAHELNTIEILKERSPLHAIQLSSRRDWDWNDFPESIRSSLVSLFQLPTVTFLGIYLFKEFPATALSGCGNLIDLQLGCLKLDPPKVNQVISRSKITTPVSLCIKKETYGLADLLNSASLHLGDPIVDLSRLQKAEFDVESRDDLAQVYELIKATTRLEYLSLITWINVVQPLKLAGLGANLAKYSYWTLKFLELYVTVVGDDHDPLCGLNGELRHIAGNNVLEELELNVVVQQDVPCRTESDDWSAFDSVLTEPGAFPMLHRVLVEFWWNSARRDQSEVGTLFESLKEDRFPRLVESKVVKFCAEHHDVW